MNRYEISLSEQLIQSDQANSKLGRGFSIHKWIERQRFLHPKTAQQLNGFPGDSSKADNTQRAVPQLSTHILRAFVPLSGAYQPGFDEQVMAQRYHPSNRCLRHRTIHRASCNCDEHISGCAGLNIYRIIPDAKSRHDQKVLRLGNTFCPYGRCEPNYPLGIAYLVRADLFVMFSENAVANVRNLVQHR